MEKYTIAFRILIASLRGTEVAIYDYACANENILHNKSIILIEDNKYHNREILNKFRSRFSVYFYPPNNSVMHIEKIMKRNRCKILYTIAYGERRVNDPCLSVNGVYRTALHCVFSLADPHADTYVPISKYLAMKFNKDPEIYVPHIVSLLEKKENVELLEKENRNSSLRHLLNIPSDAVVFGRYGGIETFNVEMTHKAIRNVIGRNGFHGGKPEIYFLFVNTYKFMDHPRVIHCDPVVDDNDKIKFIAACDAMIHGRADGETFGLACGEFSVCNRPVITCRSGDLAHIDILGDDCFIYNSRTELEDILLNFVKDVKNICKSYSIFSSENVIKMWWKHLIEPLLEK